MVVLPPLQELWAEATCGGGVYTLGENAKSNLGVTLDLRLEYTSLSA